MTSSQRNLLNGFMDERVCTLVAAYCVSAHAHVSVWAAGGPPTELQGEVVKSPGGSSQSKATVYLILLLKDRNSIFFFSYIV